MEKVYATKEGYIIKRFETPISTGWIKTEEKIVESLETIIPKVKMITADEWNTVIAFLQWVWDEHKSEGLLYGLYHTEQQKWLFVVPDQKVGSAAVVTSDLHFSQLNEGYQVIFSIHTHGSMSAFQSGQDHKDEMDGYGAGFHITLGNMDKPEMTIHCRSKFVFTQTDEDGFVIPNTKAIISMVPFTPWSLVESSVQVSMPQNLKDSLFRWERLTSRCGEFPEEWKEKVSKKVDEKKGYFPHLDDKYGIVYRDKVNKEFLDEISILWFEFLDSKPKDEIKIKPTRDPIDAAKAIAECCEKPTERLRLALVSSLAKSIHFFYNLICGTLSYNNMPNDETVTELIANAPDDFIDVLKESQCPYISFKIQEMIDDKASAKMMNDALKSL